MEHCKKCQKHVEPDIEEQVFSNGKVHLRGSCPECKQYIKYLSWDSYGLGESPNKEITDVAEQGHKNLDEQWQDAIDRDTENEAYSVFEKWQRDNGQN